MNPIGCFRAAAIAAVLAGWVLVSPPAAADAAWLNPDAAVALDAVASWLPQLTREGASPMAGEGPSVTLSVNAAIMALGSLWLVLMARRIHGRSAVDGMAGQMLSSAAPRPAAGGR